jgi:protoheme IX farnesyltransferase
LPPLIGWVAASASIGLEPVLLFLIIFFWTPPHFWALSLYRTSEYARAGIPMLPVVSGRAETQRQILMYTLVLVPVAVGPWLLGFAGTLYGAFAITSGAMMLVLALRVSTAPAADAEAAAKRLFAFSILYLFLLFVVLLVEDALTLPSGLFGIAGR